MLIENNHSFICSFCSLASLTFYGFSKTTTLVRSLSLSLHICSVTTSVEVNVAGENHNLDAWFDFIFMIMSFKWDFNATQHHFCSLSPWSIYSPTFLEGHFTISFFKFIFISWRLITLQYCNDFCHTLTWISHGYTCIPHPNPPSRLPSHPIPLGHPSAPALSTCLMHPIWAGDLFHTW